MFYSAGAQVWDKICRRLQELNENLSVNRLQKNGWQSKKIRSDKNTQGIKYCDIHINSLARVLSLARTNICFISPLNVFPIDHRSQDVINNLEA